MWPRRLDVQQFESAINHVRLFGRGLYECVGIAVTTLVAAISAWAVAVVYTCTPFTDGGTIVGSCHICERP